MLIHCGGLLALHGTLWLEWQAHPINAQRVREGKPPANVVLLRGCGSRWGSFSFSSEPCGWDLMLFCAGAHGASHVALSSHLPRLAPALLMHASDVNVLTTVLRACSVPLLSALAFLILVVASKAAALMGKPASTTVLQKGTSKKTDKVVPRIAVEPFQELHGMRACMLAPTKIIAGLGMSLGIERLTAEGATGNALGPERACGRHMAGQNKRAAVVTDWPNMFPALADRTHVPSHHV